VYFAQSLQAAWPAAGREVNQCIKRAGNDLRAMDRCDALGQRLAHTVQSDRSFALSYADSLNAQGNGSAPSGSRLASSARATGPPRYKRCRNLADDLLFG
jgi:hypothetical protein